MPGCEADQSLYIFLISPHELSLVVMIESKLNQSAMKSPPLKYSSLTLYIGSIRRTGPLPAA